MSAAYERPCRCEPNPFQCGEGCTCTGCGCVKERPVLFTGENVVRIFNDLKWQTRRTVKDPAKPEPGNAWGSCLCHEIAAIDQPCVRCEAIGGASKYGKPGDRLWVRETWAAGKGYDADPAQTPPLRRAKVGDMHKGIKVWYRADFSGPTYWATFGVGTGGLAERLHAERNDPKGRGQWRPSIFMPRWASRLQLEVTGVRIERLNEISEADAIAEGCTGFDPEPVAEGGTFYVRKGMSSAPDPRAHYRVLWESINGPGSWELNPWVWCIDFKRIEVTCG